MQAYTTWKEKIMNTVNDEYSRYQLGNQESGHFENIEFHKVLLLEYHMPPRTFKKCQIAEGTVKVCCVSIQWDTCSFIYLIDQFAQWTRVIIPTSMWTQF